MRLEGIAAQSTITCYLTTHVDKLPSVTLDRDWTESIVTAIIPPHVQTQNQLHSSYTQMVSSVHCLNLERGCTKSLLLDLNSLWHTSPFGPCMSLFGYRTPDSTDYRFTIY